MFSAQTSGEGGPFSYKVLKDFLMTVQFERAVPGLTTGLSADGRVLTLRCRRGTEAAAQCRASALGDGSAELLGKAAVAPLSPSLILMTAGCSLFGAGPASDGAACALRHGAAQALGLASADVLVLGQGRARALTAVSDLMAGTMSALARPQTGPMPAPWHRFATPLMTADGRFVAAGYAVGNPADPLGSRTTVLITDMPLTHAALSGLLKPLAASYFGWLEATGTVLPADTLMLVSTGAGERDKEPVRSADDARAVPAAAGFRLVLERLTAGMAADAGMPARLLIEGAASPAEARAAMRPLRELMLRIRSGRYAAEGDATALLWAALAEGLPADADSEKVTVTVGEHVLRSMGRFAPDAVLREALCAVSTGETALNLRLFRGSASTFLWA